MQYYWFMELARFLTKTDRGKQLLAYAILMATIGVMISIVAPSLNAPGYLSAWDAGGHLLKALYFADQLLPNGHLSGWFPTWHGGFDLFQFYPPMLYYLLGPLTYLFQPELALRLLMAGLWIGLVPATYYFLRSFDLNRIVAAAGTSFLLALNASFGIGLGALYGVGLLPNGLGFIMAIWTLGRLKRELSQPERGARQLVLTGLLFGLLVLSHTFSAYWWVAASLILLATETLGRKASTLWALKRYAIVAGIGLLVSAYWWVPLFLGIEHMGPTGAIAQSSWSDILSGLLLAKDSGGIAMAVLAAGGLAFLAFRRRWRTLAFFGGTLAFSLLLSVNAINAILPFGSVIGSSQFIRFQAFVAWLMLALAAVGLAGLWHLLKRIRLPFVPATALGSIVLLLFALVVWPTLQVKRGFINVVNNSATDELEPTAAFLDQNLRPGEFILSEFNWESRFYYGSPHFVNQRLPMRSGKVWDLDGNFPEGTLGAVKPVLAASVMDDTAYLTSQQQYLRDRGVRYIVATHPGTRVRLAALPWLRLAHPGRAISVFELVDFKTPLGLPAEAAAKVEAIEYEPPGRYRVQFKEPVSIPAGRSLALSYHPWYKVSADGKPIATDADDNDQLRLLNHANAKSLTLDYAPPAATRVAGLVSLAALLGIVAVLARPRLLQTINPPTRWRGRGAGRTGASGAKRRRPSRTRRSRS